MNLELIKQAVVEMRDDQVHELVAQALQAQDPPRKILEDGLIAGMKTVGDRFKQKKYFVPEVLLASEAFYAGFNIVQPLLKGDTTMQRGKVIIGVVHGDIHDIGKNIVRVLVEAAGFKVIDLGKDVRCETFINAVKTENPDILALSSLMTTTMANMAKVIDALHEKRLRNTLKVIVGGAPVTAEYAKKIGADGYAPDASQAASLAKAL